MNNTTKKLAFTLIELVVSLSIIALLTTIFLVNYRQSNQRTDLVMATQVMVSDIRSAQSNTLGLLKYDGAMPAGGWGASFSLAEGENNRYIIFADINESGQYEEGEADESLGGKIVYLPRNITIDHFIIENSKAESLNVTFIPPDPITQIYDGIYNKAEAQIILKESAIGTTKTVLINFAGLIDVIE